jgi:hypothetical protein
VKRRLLKPFVFLLVGAIVNVAVAWACAICKPIAQSPQRTGDAYFVFLDDAAWFIARTERFGTLHFYSSTDLPRDVPATTEYLRPADPFLDRALPRWTRARQGDPGSFINVYEDAWGWPMVCLRTSPLTSASRDAVTSARWNDVLPLEITASKTLLLPLRLIGAAFIIDTVIYACFIWLLTSLRRWMQILRHQCSACGYPRGSSAVCTECGAAFRARTEGAKECSHE